MQFARKIVFLESASLPRGGDCSVKKKLFLACFGLESLPQSVFVLKTWFWCYGNVYSHPNKWLLSKFQVLYGLFMILEIVDMNICSYEF